ncbi:hypothetical protein LJR231_003488 [Phyllobacterium sp. LjRoot231]|uniref:hypothetical protein n=1 Tax=Phyllobacterium sp. LjRoot231 TaxID=3342289 RepID=UPI003ED0210B
MSEKMTRVRLPGSKFKGLMDWGEKSHAEMVAQVRRHAQHQMEEAQAALAAADTDFQVDLVRGPYVHTSSKELSLRCNHDLSQP